MVKSFLRAYTLPLIVLTLGGGIYYFIFSKSVQTQQAESTPVPSIATKDLESTSKQNHKEAKDTPQSTDIALSDTAEDHAQHDSTQTLRTDSTDSASDMDHATQATQAALSQELPQKSSQEATPPSAPVIAQSPESNAQTPKSTYYAKATSLNIRAIPKTSGRILGKLTLGQSVVVTEIQGEWAKLESGGWVSLALLSSTEPTERLYLVLPNILNIRQAPESSAPVIGALYKGQKIQVETTQGEWAKLESGGWVSIRLIKAL